MTTDERVLELLEQQLVMLRALAMPQIRSTLESLLKSDQECAAFEASDGTRTTREIAATAGVKSPNTIAVWWRKWRAAGVAVEAPGRKTMHVLSLSDVGLPIKARLEEE